MTRESLLIAGGTGLLGLNWACAVRDRYDVVLAAHQHECTLKGVSVVRVRLEDDEECAKLVRDIRPAWVVHAAGLASVDICEAAPADADIGSSMRAGRAGPVLWLDEELPRWRTLVSSVEPEKT